jgi:hypothetical protein
MELLHNGSAGAAKAVETRNLSTSGVLFASGVDLPVGQPIEYAITLPTGRAETSVRLHCMGKVVRSEPFDTKSHIAATLERYEFIRR